MGELWDGQPLFPGDSEIDQLYHIQKVLGELTSEQSEMFSKNPRFLGLKFPDVSKPETLNKKYVGKMSKKALSLMDGLLKMDPSNRITGIAALNHPYFDDIRFKDDEYFKITEGDANKHIDTTRPIQSSQGILSKIEKQALEDKNRNNILRGGITAYSGFDNSSINDIPPKRNPKNWIKTKKTNQIYEKRTLYDIK